MKNIFKIALIAVVVAIAGFALMGCPLQIQKGDVYVHNYSGHNPEITIDGVDTGIVVAPGATRYIGEYTVGPHAFYAECINDYTHWGTNTYNITTSGLTWSLY
jgi:hypothetical protein